MRFLDIIIKKRDGKVLNKSEIEKLVEGYTSDSLPDYQMAAWLMAVYLNGMTSEETAALTLAMAASGTTMNLSSVPGIKVDKHSTGGVADTTTLILGPLVAAANIPVAKMSGRGLGFTGGTIDKLEAIPGFRTTLDEHEFIKLIKQNGIALTSQNSMIAPADGKIYALRDVSATVESIPLIASSIMSKKIAAGADKILLDVKVGNGAFMKDMKSATDLATAMVEIGTHVGRETIAILTNMNEPLGHAIGNSLEVREAIEVLKGGGPDNLRHVCLVLGSYMLKLAGYTKSLNECYCILEGLIKDHSALIKFKQFIAGQGGNPEIVDNDSLLPQARYKVVVQSRVEGYVEKIDSAKLGYAAMILGAGREYKDQKIDLAAGINFKCKIGDKIRTEQTVAIIYTNAMDKIDIAKALITESLTLCKNPIQPTKLILGIVDKNGYRSFQDWR